MDEASGLLCGDQINPADDDRITGELPLKSVQRAAAAPEWSPPDQTTANQEDLVYAVVTDNATADQDEETRRIGRPSR
jgi:hypothetical protein